MEPVDMEIPNFTKEDFLDTAKPFEWLYQFKNNHFLLNRMTKKLIEVARPFRITGIKAMYQDYEKTIQQTQSGLADANITRFDGQELELACGSWLADDMGVSTRTPLGERFACMHPILPVLRLVNIDTGLEKIKLAYRKGKEWRRVTVDKKTVASANSIVSLADRGIAVTSENARYLVQYLSDVENMNYEIIPEKASVGRLGWVQGGFSPYVEGLEFDGDEKFKFLFESVEQKGSAEKWLELARTLRREGGIPVRMILAASFASVLVKPMGALSFFVHIWGGGSGIGKTVGLMLAASVWAIPEMGRYAQSFKSSEVHRELAAGFLNSLPLILDELQIVKRKEDLEQTVYMLAEGVGKGRGAKDGGVQRLQTWRNCILTSGEMPITNFVTGAGAINRILEVECTERLFSDPQATCAIMMENHGWAGKMFVEFLQEDGNLEEAKSVYQIYYNEIVQSETTEKQAMAGALLLTADYLASEWLFKDGKALTAEEIAPCLQSKRDVDTGERAYGYLCEAVAVNANRFRDRDNPGEIWGLLEPDEGRVYINRNVFARLCADGGFSDRAVLSWLIRNKLIETSVDKRSQKPQPTVQKKIGGTNTKCVLLTLDQVNEEELEMIEELSG